jgi:hypothetical protein
MPRHPHVPAPRSFLAALLVLTAISGCNCDDGLQRIDDPKEEPAEPGLDIIEEPEMPEPEPPADPVWSLTWAETSPVELHFGEVRPLHAMLVDDRGQPVSNVPVAFEVSDPAVALGSLEVMTDATGTAEVDLLAGALAVDVVITANAPFASPAELNVQVLPPPIISLEVHTSTTARIPLPHSELFVFTFAPDASVSCATLPGDVSAEQQATLGQLPTLSIFQVGNDAKKVVVLAAGYGPTGDLVATGCGETVTHTADTSIEPNVVEVEIHQLPSVLEGEYDVLMSMALGGLLPEPYESTVDLITGVLADPAGYAVYRALRNMDEDSGTSFVHWDLGMGDELASFDDVRDNPATFPTWSLARDLFADELEQSLGPTYTDITTVGGDLRDIVTDFEIGARLSVAADDEADPFDNALVVDELWNDLVFEWSRGCAEGDLACIRRPIALENTQYAPVTTSYGATWAHDPSGVTTERFNVTADPHRLALRYGAILLIALDELLYPALGADSLSGFLINLVDCTAVGQAIADALGGPPFLYTGFCTTGMTLAANQIEEELLALEVGEGDPELDIYDEEGAVGDAWFWLTDADRDLFTEEVPMLEVDVRWVDPDNPDVSEEVAAPITGAGRLAATGCTRDLDCGSNETCQPVPHYLLVAEVELDCRRAVGALLGEADCSSDEQCASGLCNAGHCYAACADDGACGEGSCSLFGATLDLDGTMTGLGQVPAPSCVLP